MWTQQNELGMYQPFLWSYRNCCIIHHAFSGALVSVSYFLLWLCGVAEVAAFGLWLCGLGWLACRLLVRVLPALHVLFWDPGRGAALTCGVVFSRCRLEAPRGKSRNTDWFLRPVLLWPLVKASHMVKCSIREGESGNNGDLLNSDFFFFLPQGKFLLFLISVKVCVRIIDLVLDDFQCYLSGPGHFFAGGTFDGSKFLNDYKAIQIFNFFSNQLGIL